MAQDLAQKSQPVSHKSVVGSRRIFTVAFKLQVLESYRNDIDCRGNQRATARKFGIHRRQIQKWLQSEVVLRKSLENSPTEQQSAPAATMQQTPSMLEPGNKSVIKVEPQHQQPQTPNRTPLEVPKSHTATSGALMTLSQSSARLRGDSSGGGGGTDAESLLLEQQQQQQPQLPQPQHQQQSPPLVSSFSALTLQSSISAMQNPESFYASEVPHTYPYLMSQAMFQQQQLNQFNSYAVGPQEYLYHQQQAPLVTRHQNSTLDQQTYTLDYERSMHYPVIKSERSSPDYPVYTVMQNVSDDERHLHLRVPPEDYRRTSIGSSEGGSPAPSQPSTIESHNSRDSDAFVDASSSDDSEAAATSLSGDDDSHPRRRSFSLHFKLGVLDHFHGHNDTAGNQRATARKFNINRRQVQKWLSQESELRGLALTCRTERQRLGPMSNDSGVSSPVDLSAASVEFDSNQNAIEDEESVNSQAPGYCSCCPDGQAFNKRRICCIESPYPISEEVSPKKARTIEGYDEPVQDTPLCLVKPKIVKLSAEPTQQQVNDQVPAISSKKDQILFKPYLDIPSSKSSRQESNKSNLQNCTGRTRRAAAASWRESRESCSRPSCCTAACLASKSRDVANTSYTVCGDDTKASAKARRTQISI
uniref:Brinker DNA-binding domain-containing protein n=1 Tax=Trichogramma kaykai TaxID=54128 RepID=A0ABD2XDI4_9HYME